MISMSPHDLLCHGEMNWNVAQKSKRGFTLGFPISTPIPGCRGSPHSGLGTEVTDNCVASCYVQAGSSF